VIDMSEYVTFT